MVTIKKLSKNILKLLNKNTLLLAIFASLCLVVFSVGLGWYNNKVVPRSTNPVANYSAEPSNPLSFMSNWDGPDYISIAEHGYQSSSQASFFPLYPLLIRTLNKVIGSPLDSALVISWTCLIGAAYYYLKILKHFFKINGNLKASKGLIFFILFPTSVFLAATYTESLFAFLALAAIYYALNKRYELAAVFAALGCITHLDGVFILVLACLILLEEKAGRLKTLATFLVSLLGITYYSFFLNQKFFTPLGFILAQEGHGWLNHHYTELIQTISFFNIVFIILLIVAIVYWWNRRRSFSYYSFLFLLIPIIGNQFGGFNRYMLIAFPVQFMAYDYLKDRSYVYSLAVAGIGIIWAYFTLQYTGGYIGG